MGIQDITIPKTDIYNDEKLSEIEIEKFLASLSASQDLATLLMIITFVIVLCSSSHNCYKS